MPLRGFVLALAHYVTSRWNHNFKPYKLLNDSLKCMKIKYMLTCLRSGDKKIQISSIYIKNKQKTVNFVRGSIVRDVITAVARDVTLKSKLQALKLLNYGRNDVIIGDDIFNMKFFNIFSNVLLDSFECLHIF